MFSVIFSQIQGLIGRTFILAGLLPSTILIIGYYLYLFGENGIFKLVDKFTLQGTTPSTDLNLIVILWLVLGGLFVFFRLVILYFVVALPGILLKPIRYYLETRMLRKRKLALQKKEKILFARTALDWYLKGFSKPKFIQNFIDIPKKNQAFETSGIARRIITYLMNKHYSPFHIPSRWQFNAIRRGLCDLYAYGSQQVNDSDYDDEIVKWNALIQSDAAKEILQHVSNSILREHAIAHKKYSSFPEDVWIKPTQIGNLMSALDDYSEKRYGIDTATMWTRLWWIITDSEKKEIMNAKFQVELLLNHMTSFLLLFGMVVINSLLTIIDFNLVTTALSFWGVVFYMTLMLSSSILLYRSAVFAFQTIKDKTTSLIDLYRHVLLKKLGYLPADVKEEIELFKELHAFFVQGNSRDQNRKIDFEK